MHRIAYVSTASPDLHPAAVRDLVDRSARRNLAQGITGLLLHGCGLFFQILEGEEPAVTRLFGSIERDPRHGDLCLISSSPIERRLFGTWAMKGVSVDDERIRPRADHLRALLRTCRTDAVARVGAAAEIEAHVRQVLLRAG